MSTTYINYALQVVHMEKKITRLCSTIGSEYALIDKVKLKGPQIYYMTML